jgi:hypothetical protein
MPLLEIAEVEDAPKRPVTARRQHHRGRAKQQLPSR